MLACFLARFINKGTVYVKLAIGCFLSLFNFVLINSLIFLQIKSDLIIYSIENNYIYLLPTHLLLDITMNSLLNYK